MVRLGSLLLLLGITSAFITLASGQGTIGLWKQCGGKGNSGDGKCGRSGYGPCIDAAWSSPTCKAGSRCVRDNEWWWQCEPAPAGKSPPPPPPVAARRPPPPPPPESNNGGCPAGWLPAVGTLFDSWPKPGSSECSGFNGCTWAGQFSSIDGGSSPNCRNGAQYINSDCRFPESLVKSWRVAATADTNKVLLGRKLVVMVQGKPGRTTTVNVVDVCKDSDCSGCCSANTGNNKWKLLDLEKWAAYELLGNFDPNTRNFDINNVDAPSAGSQRPGAPGDSVMALCYKDDGKCNVAASPACK